MRRAVGGVPEILAGDRCGLLVEPRSPGALARAFARLAAEPDLRRHLAAEARARIPRRLRSPRHDPPPRAALPLAAAADLPLRPR